MLLTTQYVGEAEYCDEVVLISEGQVVAHAAPAELRRMALGGDMIEVGTQGPFDAGILPAIEGVVSVRQTDASHLLVVARDAGPASPKVIDAIEAAGGKVDFSREYGPARRGVHGPRCAMPNGTAVRGRIRHAARSGCVGRAADHSHAAQMNALRELFIGLFESVVRVVAQVRKELIQVRRRPAAYFSLVLGPFLIMAVFGIGYAGVRPPLAAEIVIPEGLSLPTDTGFYQDLVG